MPKFDWGAFIEAFAKTGLPMYKDIRQQQIAMRGQDITQQHYAAAAAAEMERAQTARRQLEYNIGAAQGPDEPPWQPSGGIGGDVSRGQLMTGVPMSLRYAEEQATAPASPPPTQAPPPSPMLPSPVPGLEGGQAAPTPPPQTLDEVKKRISQTSDLHEKSRLLGVQAQLVDREQKQVIATLGEMNTKLKEARELKGLNDIVKRDLAKIDAKKAEYAAQLKETTAPEQRNKLILSINRLGEVAKVYESRLSNATLSFQALDLDLERHTKMLAAYGVDPELIQEYRRAYGDNEAGIGYLGRQIVTQASGAKKFGTPAKGGRPTPAPSYGTTRPPQPYK